MKLEELKNKIIEFKLREGTAYESNAEDITLTLIERVERLSEALEKYANPKTHSMDKEEFVWNGDYFDLKTAKDALEKYGKDVELK